MGIGYHDVLIIMITVTEAYNVTRRHDKPHLRLGTPTVYHWHTVVFGTAGRGSVSPAPVRGRNGVVMASPAAPVRGRIGVADAITAWWHCHHDGVASGSIT